MPHCFVSLPFPWMALDSGTHPMFDHEDTRDRGRLELLQKVAKNARLSVLRVRGRILRRRNGNTSFTIIHFKNFKYSPYILFTLYISLQPV